MKRFLILFVLVGLLSVKGLSRDSGYTIDGPATVAVNEVDTYTIDPNDGFSYSWSVTNGVILSGQGTSSVTIQWNGTPGPGEVDCNVDNGVGIGILDTNVG